MGRKPGEGASNLPGSGSTVTGGNEVACLATVGTEVVVSTATALIRGERTAARTRPIKVHWTSARRKRRSLEAGLLLLLLLLLLGVVTDLDGSRLIVLDGNG